MLADPSPLRVALVEREAGLVIRTAPLLIVRSPLKVLVPVRARVALPSLFRERVPTPSWMLPAKTELELLDVPTLRVTGATKVLVTILVTPPLMLVVMVVL